ncbi:MAG: signal peptidase I [Planctomycetota bacterium]
MCLNLLRAGRIAVIAFILASLFQNYCITSYRVSGNSMLPNFTDGDRVVVASLPAFLLSPKDGDTVIVKGPDGDTLIKRVAASPGETIEIKHSSVYRNGQLVAETIPAEMARCDDYAPRTLHQDEFFLLGDHRRISIDSRDFGPVKRDAIVGRVILRMPAGEALPAHARVP